MSDKTESNPPKDSVSLSEILETMKVSDIVDESENRLALVTIDMENKTIDFIGAWYTKEEPYWIPFSELQSVIQYLEWVRHIGDKEWITTDHLVVFAHRYMFLVRNEILPSAFYDQRRKR